MKFKLEQIYAAMQAIKIIDMTASVGREALVISDRFTEPLLVYVNKIEKHKNNLVVKYATRKEVDGKIYVDLGTNNYVKFEKDLCELLAEEIEVNIDLLSREICDRANLSPAERRSLKPFVKPTDQKEGEKK